MIECPDTSAIDVLALHHRLLMKNYDLCYFTLNKILLHRHIYYNILGWKLFVVFTSWNGPTVTCVQLKTVLVEELPKV